MDAFTKNKPKVILQSSGEVWISLYRLILLQGGKIISVSGYSAVGGHRAHGQMLRGYWDLLRFAVVGFIYFLFFRCS